MPRASSKISTIVRSFIQFKLLRWSFRMGGWLAPQASGEKIATFGLTEPAAGSDVRGIRTLSRGPSTAAGFVK